MGERNFAGRGDASAADEAAVGDGVVRGAEGPRGEDALAGFEEADGGIDAGGFERFFEAEGREDRGEAAREKSFARAGRADHEDVVSAGGGDGEGAFGGFLAAHFGEVDVVGAGIFKDIFKFDVDGIELQLAGEEAHDLGEGADGDDVESGDDAGFVGVGGGDDEAFESGLADGHGGGQTAAHGSEGAVESEFADDGVFVEEVGLELAGGGEEAQRGGQVEGGTFFFDVAGGVVDGDVVGGHVVAGVADGGFDAVF